MIRIWYCAHIRISLSPVGEDRQQFPVGVSPQKKKKRRRRLFEFTWTLERGSTETPSENHQQEKPSERSMTWTEATEQRRSAIFRKNGGDPILRATKDWPHKSASAFIAQDYASMRKDPNEFRYNLVSRAPQQRQTHSHLTKIDNAGNATKTWDSPFQIVFRSQ